MFGFLKKAAQKEHAKLIFQNNRAAAYVRAFNPELAGIAENQVESLSIVYAPGTEYPPEIAASLMETNRTLRSQYDRTLGAHKKKFDEAFRPIMGWNDYYKNLDIG